MSDSKQPTYPTAVAHVTFFEDRARVERVATLSASVGLSEVRLTGITALIDDPSVVVALEPPIEGARVLTAKVRRYVREEQDGSEEEVQAIIARSNEAKKTVDLATREVERQRQALERLDAIEQTLRVQLYRGHSDATCEPEQWLASLSKLGEELDALCDAKADAQHKLDEARREVERASTLLSQALQVTREVEAAVEVQLENHTGEELEVRVELRYFTACALWRPSHRARLIRDEDAGDSIEIETLATIWQHTGEKWKDIPCSFSTARPTQAAKPPLIQDDVLNTRPKTEEERRTIQVEARDVDISTASSGKRTVEEMPGVDDGGEPLKLQAEKPVSPPSTGRPVHVPISITTIPCEVETIAYPELSPVAHLRAKANWEGAHPLLAGPMALLRGDELVGKAPLGFVSPGEAFEIGFGVEAGIRIKRIVRDKDIPRKLTRWTRTERTVELHVSNMSGEKRNVSIIERLPVSEIEQVVIEPTELPASTSPDEDGFLKIARDLGPRATDEYRVVYHIDKAHNVNLNF